MKQTFVAITLLSLLFVGCTEEVKPKKIASKQEAMCSRVFLHSKTLPVSRAGYVECMRTKEHKVATRKPLRTNTGVKYAKK